MPAVEAESLKGLDLGSSVKSSVFFERPLSNPEAIVEYPHLSAWLETFGEIRVDMPRDVLLLFQEAPYRKAEVEATRREAGLVALSSLIIASKMGLSTSNELGQISDKMSRIIAGKKVVEDEKLDTEDTIGRIEAETFIQEGIGFLAAIDRLRLFPDSFPLRRFITNYLTSTETDPYDDDHNIASLLKRNNIGLSGGLALFGMAIPKSAFIGNHARSRFGQVVAADPAAKRIYESLKEIVFDGSSVEMDGVVSEFLGGEQMLPPNPRVSKEVDLEDLDKQESLDGKKILEGAADDVLKRHK